MKQSPPQTGYPITWCRWSAPEQWPRGGELQDRSV